MNKEGHYDAVIIGAGQGGIPLATTLANEGWKTVIVERDRVGGTCINTGCTPTKTMVASARVAHMARRSGDYGINAGGVTVDMAAVRQRKRDIVERFRQSTLNRIMDSQAELIRGEARFISPKTLQVTLEDGTICQLSADTIFIDTGARARIPDIPGLDRVSYLDSTTIMELDEVPDHLLIVGGGYVGVEFGQMFRRFGSQVTIIQRAGQLLTHEDGDIAQALSEILQEDGLRIMLNCQPTEIKSFNGSVCLMVEQDQEQAKHTLTGSHVLIATGRVPNSESLNLERVGIDTDDYGHICVNERLETSVEGVYALGDVKGGPAFTHISYDDYRILRENLLKDGDATTNGRLVPYTVFIDPQLGRVGLTEAQAQSLGVDYDLAKMPMTYVSRAVELGQSSGFVKALVNTETKKILGCAVLGVQGGEFMAILQVAMMGKLPYTSLHEGIFTHPTLAEGLNTLFSNIETT